MNFLTHLLRVGNGLNIADWSDRHHKYRKQNKGLWNLAHKRAVVLECDRVVIDEITYFIDVNENIIFRSLIDR